MTDKRDKDMRARLSKTMVHNPIYDRYGTGPLYESVKPPQFDTPTRFLLEATNRHDTATSMDQQKHSIRSRSLRAFQNKHIMVNKTPDSNLSVNSTIVTFLMHHTLLNF